MGLMDFVKDAGEKLFGAGKAKATMQEAAAAPADQAKLKAANDAAAAAAHAGVVVVIVVIARAEGIRQRDGRDPEPPDIHSRVKAGHREGLNPEECAAPVPDRSCPGSSASACSLGRPSCTCSHRRIAPWRS